MNGNTGESKSAAQDGPDTRWEGIRRRPETSRTALEKRFAPTVEERDEILKARAVELAREAVGEAAADTQIRVVEFVLAQEKYSIEPDFVRDIFPLKTFTSIPCTPSFVLGVTNLRGEILSVIDLKRFFNLPDKGLSSFTKVIVLESEAMTFGILADAVIGTQSIPLADIQPPLPTLTEVREEYLKGVTNDGIAILDAESLLSDEKLVICEEVHTGS